MNNHKLRRYYLEKDYNCAETILRAANEEYHLGLNEDSFRLVSGFGGGMEKLWGIYKFSCLRSQRLL